MRVYPVEGGLPIKSWCMEPEAGALSQAQNLARLPFAFHHIALMPDTHEGYGMPIGGVLAARGAIIPNAVGVDIGCGMLAAKTSLESIDRETLTRIMQRIRGSVPVGFSHNSTKADIEPPPDGTVIVAQQYESARNQAGTLGGGNHFIEIQRGSDGHIWFMLHSGSRNLGKKVCDHYNKLATAMNKQWHTAVPPIWDLAFLPEQSEEGQAYIAEMGYCQRFALLNRQKMAERVMEALQAECNGITCLREINIHHNYARMEHHFGSNVWVHRKGATSAREGEYGIIPGSQGTKSYIVIGRGNQDSFTSCSHGAGRRMGRKQAQRTLSLEAEIRNMEEQGILHGIRSISDLDEAAGAYKDIDLVMAEQTDLVDIDVALSPMAVIKG